MIRDRATIDINFQDLVGSIGGYLGLFLGWSFMSLVTAAPAWIRLLAELIARRQKNKESLP